MSKQASRTVIGGFVLGAIVLAVIAITIFGKGDYFKKRPVYVMFFQGSVKGLQVGSPVLLRGVRIGSVKKINIDFYPDTDEVEIPVFVEMEPDSIHVRGKTHFVPGSPERQKVLIEEGLRGQLEMQSLITGQLLIQLNFHPDTPAKFVGRYPKYQEIPTIPSTTEEIMNLLKKFPLEETAHKLIKILDGLDDFINSPDFQGIPAEAKGTIKDTRGLVQNINTHVEPIASKMGKTIDNYDKLARDFDVKVTPVLADLRAAIQKGKDALAQVEQTMDIEHGKSAEIADSIGGAADAIARAADDARPALTNIKDLTAEDATTIYNLNSMLKETAAAARSIRTLTDYLARHPEALISGKGGRKGR
ncbi:MlaD family protein [Thermodesulfobacteriota bacterium]